jgi:uncharacterized protein
MPVPSTAFTLDITDLLGRPGASRPLALELDVPEGLDLPLVEQIEALRLDGVLESLVDGVLVRGTLSARIDVACARCLSPFGIDAAAEIAELYTEPGPDAEEVEPGYEVRDGSIDLDALVRDALLPLLPVAPVCRPDCRGLCPTCGADRNVEDCSCAEPVRDTRWGALEALRLSEPPPS